MFTKRKQAEGRKALIRCVKLWRKKRGMSKRELGRRMAGNEMWAYRYEGGEVKRLDVMEFARLADILQFDAICCFKNVTAGRTCFD